MNSGDNETLIRPFTDGWILGSEAFKQNPEKACTSTVYNRKNKLINDSLWIAAGYHGSRRTEDGREGDGNPL